MDLRTPSPTPKVTQKPKKQYIRNFLIAFFALILTTLAVNATDYIGNFQGSLLGSAIDGVLPEKDFCEDGMSQVSSPNGDFCIDTFELSAGSGCLYKNPQNINETQDNIISPSCKAVSVRGVVPWTNISQNQAVEMCAKMGKHLPSNQEWFLASLGTPDRYNGWGDLDCNVAQNWDGGGIGKGGSGSQCVSSSGAYDMIGNVWEWTFETVDQGSYRNVKLPDAGFVHAVNSEGLPIDTKEEPSNIYYFDRFWINKEITTGIFRGGYFGSESDAGRYAVHTEIPPSFSGGAVGFRCAK